MGAVGTARELGVAVRTIEPCGFLNSSPPGSSRGLRRYGFCLMRQQRAYGESGDDGGERRPLEPGTFVVQADVAGRRR